MAEQGTRVRYHSGIMSWYCASLYPGAQDNSDFHNNGPLAQLVEQLTLNQRVVGSIPTRPTIILIELARKPSAITTNRVSLGVSESGSGLY